MKQTVEVDIAIIGGGIAGLWLLNELRQQGYSTVLMESGTLGGEQTHKAQGIIHGGMKYAMQGAVTNAAEAISSMPQVWERCLSGEGTINLSEVPVLSQYQYLWTTGNLTSKLAGFFAGLALKGNVTSLKEQQFPPVFQHPKFKGQVYSLDEIVIDVNVLIRELVKPNQDVIFKIDPPHLDHLQFDAQKNITSFEIQAHPMPALHLTAKKYVFAAGAGNELFLQASAIKTPGMQLRPLHMVVAKHDFPYEVYAHCLGLGATPRMTITTHQAADGKKVWYLGGQIAEEGVNKTSEEQIAATRKELQELFSWLDFSDVEFASFLVDRAEVAQPGGKRPDSCFMHEIGNSILTWPTKLAFAPMLAQQIIRSLEKEAIHSGKVDIRELRAWPMPAFARPIWDQLLCS